MSFFCVVTVLLSLSGCNRKGPSKSSAGESVSSTSVNMSKSWSGNVSGNISGDLSGNTFGDVSENTSRNLPAPVTVAVGELPTEEEARNFARELETSLKDGDASVFIRAIDWSNLTNRVLAGIPVTEQARFDRRYLLQLFSEDGGIAQSVADKIRQGGTYHFLRTRPIDEHTLAVTFRLVDVDGGLDYHDLYLQRRGKNLIQIQEFYLYHFDETFSETLRRTLVPDLYAGGQSDYGMMMSDVILLIYRENQLLIQEFSRAAEEKNAVRALDLFEQLPPELQGQKTFQFWRLQAAQAHTDAQQYEFVLAEVHQRYRDESWADFLSLDYYFGRRDFRSALTCLDRIEKQVGGDPYLASFRCWALLNLQNYTEAQACLENAIKQEPELAKNPSFISLRERLKNVSPLNPFRINLTK
ncbi:MAG: hypothetical protein Q4C70_02210 [Planctomycetia bacterium]|nr:hypothetical protein [Planctomycetia bacterium]